ncbi:MAG: lipoprotein [Rhodocyclaceae bacterium]|jgi:predicted small lipoprotein YifL|nr:lipoprotein [Rhodocyclaceae bacterium]MCL4758680.1 lipoprotein [Rhodocyclaceae bacterium]
MSRLSWILLTAAAVLLASCGIKGPLHLPESKHATGTATVPGADHSKQSTNNRA